MKALLVLAGMILLLPAALGIGRSGNGTIIDPKSGVTFGQPARFVEATELPGGRLRLISYMPEPSMGAVGNPFLEISSFGFSLSGFAGLGRAELKEAMQAQGWVSKPTQDPCVDAYRQSGNGSLAELQAWGVGKGVVVVGPQSFQVKQALDEIRATLRLNEGACAW
jgi:hypothetical protein